MATYKKKCIRCGLLIDGDSAACAQCGTRNPFGFNCPACRTSIDRSQVVCPGCSRPLATPCPNCSQPAFIGDEGCGYCGVSLLRLCPNKRCRQPQFFENTKCSACGKAIKK